MVAGNKEKCANTNSTAHAALDHSKVTIEENDFVYDGVPHSLRFHWLFMEGHGRGTEMRYVYSPLRGLVNVQGNEWPCDCCPLRCYLLQGMHIPRSVAS